jgi:hypothetical protein
MTAPSTGVRAYAEAHPLRVAAMVGAAAAVGLLLRMLLPGPVGLSDQGDGHRLLCQLGLRNDVPWNTSQADYVYPTWVEHRFYGQTCGANGTGEPYFSSQLGLLRFARFLTPILHLPGDLDLRALAVVCCLLAGLAIGWLVAEVRGPAWARVGVGVAVTIVVADSGIAPYFASPYSEPAAFLGVLFLCPALLRFLREPKAGFGLLAAIAAIAAFTLTSKSQMISLLPPLVVVLLARPGPGPDWSTAATRTRRIAGIMLSRTAGIVVAGGLILLSASYLSAQPPRFAELNMYNQVFGTILPNSDDKEVDLRWFGLDPSLARGSGSNVLSPDSVAPDPAYAGFADKVHPGDIARFYLTHPARLPDLISDGLDAAAQFRLEPYLANYPPNSGAPPHTMEHRMELFTLVFALFGQGAILLIGWIGALAGFVIGTKRRSPEGQLGLVLLVGLLSQFAVIMMTDGAAETIKHMVVVDFMTGLLPAIALAAYAGRRKRQPQPDEIPATEPAHTEDTARA